MAKSMDFPKKKKYSETVKEKTITENTFTLDIQAQNDILSLQGPKGDRGPKGEIGPKGDKGDSGDQGQKGLKGDPGKDGKNYVTSSGQNPGWAYYFNDNQPALQLGASRGVDGWVSFYLDGNNIKSNEEFLPLNTTSFWNKENRKINFKALKIGSIVKVRYDFAVETFSNNTEVWIRTFMETANRDTTTYVGLLKYQHIYEMSSEQTIYIENKSIKISGGIPQLRTDNPAALYVKGIYISVS